MLTYIQRDIRGYTTEGPLGRDHLRVFLPDEDITVINIYRPPNEGSQGRLYLDLLTTTIQGRTIVAGYFNAFSLL